MPGLATLPEAVVERSLFGGAISCSFPLRFQVSEHTVALEDLLVACMGKELIGESPELLCPRIGEDVSDVREVPDNQEVFADPNRDESIVIELLEFKYDVNDEASASWFLQDLAREQDATQDLVIEAGRWLSVSESPFMPDSTVMNSAVGKLAVSKGREGVEASNLVRVHLVDIRLRHVQTDLLITAYEPLFISEQSSAAGSVGAGETTAAELAGIMSVADVQRLVLSTFKIVDWSLFG